MTKWYRLIGGSIVLAGFSFLYDHTVIVSSRSCRFEARDEDFYDMPRMTSQGSRAGPSRLAALASFGVEEFPASVIALCSFYFHISILMLNPR